jgi:hypothetical protein
MAMRVEKISAVTFRVADMALSVQFYRDVLGMELLFGGEDAGFSSLRVKDVQSVILNLDLGLAPKGVLINRRIVLNNMLRTNGWDAVLAFKCRLPRLTVQQQRKASKAAAARRNKAAERKRST